MNWKNLIKTVAPVLGTALGGPLGGAATKFLAGKLLGDENATAEQLEQFVAGASPEQLLRLKELDKEFATEMRRLDVDLERLAQADRASARELAGKDMRPHMVISGAYTGMYALVLYLLFTGEIDITEAHMPLVHTVIGILTAAQTQIMNFWFGSSVGSKEKDRSKNGGVH